MPVTTTRRSPSRRSALRRTALPSRGMMMLRSASAPLLRRWPAASAAEHAAQLLDLDLQKQRVAGDDHAPEAAVVDAGEEPDLADTRRASERSGGLGQRLDQEDTRHDRLRLVAGELRLVGRDLLDADRSLAGRELDDAVDEEEQVSMREDPSGRPPRAAASGCWSASQSSSVSCSRGSFGFRRTRPARPCRAGSCSRARPGTRRCR